MRFTRFLTSLIAVLIIAPFAAAQPTVRLATLAPSGTTFHQELLAMGEKWAKAPGGGAKLIIYTNGQLGGEADMVKRMRADQIQAAMLTVTGLSEIDDSVAALQNMPMFFRNAGELEYVREKLRPQFEQKFREKGFVVLFWGDAGWLRFFSRKPGTTPDDFRKMKLFTYAGYSKTTDLWRAGGFQPVPLQLSDALTALNTGLIDAIATEPYYALAGQFYGPTPNMLDLKWAPLVGGAVVKEKTFSALSAETQKAMLAAAAEAGVKLTAESRKQSDDSIEVMKTKHGLHVQTLSPELEAQWRKQCEAFYPKIRGSIVPAEMFDRVQALLAEYRGTPAVSSSTGNP